MITEAIITDINPANNYCVVRIPLLETVNTKYPPSVTATFACPPGVYNGFKENDVVWVGFVNNRPEVPVILGKIYKGVGVESNDPTTAISCIDLVATNSATLPVTTKIENADTEYDTLKKIINKAKEQEVKQTPRYLVIINSAQVGYDGALHTPITNDSLDIYFITNNYYTNLGIAELFRNLDACGFNDHTCLFPVESNTKEVFGIYVQPLMGGKYSLKAVNYDGTSLTIYYPRLKCLNITNI